MPRHHPPARRARGVLKRLATLERKQLMDEKAQADIAAALARLQADTAAAVAQIKTLAQAIKDAAANGDSAAVEAIAETINTRCTELEVLAPAAPAPAGEDSQPAETTGEDTQPETTGADSIAAPGEDSQPAAE